MALIPMENGGGTVLNTTVSSYCTGTFKCVKQGDIYIGQGSLVVTTEVPAYRILVSGIPYDATAYVNVLVMGMGLNEAYTQNGNIVNRIVLPVGTELRISVFGLVQS